MKWDEVLKEIRNKKKIFLKTIIDETDLDTDSAALLHLIASISIGNQFVEPEKLKPELGKVGVNLFDPTVTKSIQTLYEKGFVRLGIALNTESQDES